MIETKVADSRDSVSWWSHALHVGGLSALGIVQPVLDLISQYPQFLAAQKVVPL